MKAYLGAGIIQVVNEIQNAVVKFKVGGPLRFLSHTQMLMVFQRACVRADLNLKYSEGFNPHPRLSLPLPRTVGVESDDESAIFSIVAYCSDQQAPNAAEKTRIEAELSAQLPAGCELISVYIDREKVSFQPGSAVYVLILKEQEEYLLKKLKNTAKELLDSESLVVSRPINIKSSNRGHTGRGGAKSREINVRDYLESIDFDDRKIMIKFRITSTGSIRIQEILDLLNLDIDKLAVPIRRTNVQWQDRKY
jgi:radical SAM-linked protein